MTLLVEYSYPAQIQMSGGVSKMVPLRLNEATKKWYLDMNELEAAITPKTKLMILNTPHNVSWFAILDSVFCNCY